MSEAMMGQRPFRTKGLDHVVLRAKDIDSMLAFYRDVLGLPVVKHNEPLGLWHLDAGGSMIDIVDMNGVLGQKGGPAPTEAKNVDHVALKVGAFDEQEVRAYFDRLGIWTEEQVKTRFGAEGDGPSLYLRDPEGNGVELKAVG
ncbi:MAG: VOC family protein [Alphaproteobacteria bacterium]|nr:VOC family protein [Alphaproteobacteria bacterium]